MSVPFHFTNPWRVEARATPFHPWIVIEPAMKTLDAAMSLAAEAKGKRGRARPHITWYATRVRTNY